MATTSKEDLALLPGFGPLKVFDFPLTVGSFQNIKSSISEGQNWRIVGSRFNILGYLFEN